MGLFCSYWAHWGPVKHADPSDPLHLGSVGIKPHVCEHERPGEESEIQSVLDKGLLCILVLSAEAACLGWKAETLIWRISG